MVAVAAGQSGVVGVVTVDYLGIVHDQMEFQIVVYAFDYYSHDLVFSLAAYLFSFFFAYIIK